MSSAIIIALAVWWGFNAAFFAIRLYATADHTSPGVGDFVGYPRLVS
jgi:hypothetical protein